MSGSEKKNEIVPFGSRSLRVHSADLVSRGLESLLGTKDVPASPKERGVTGANAILRNKWTGGPVRFDGLGLLPEYDGLLPFYAELDPEVGTEVILTIRDQTDFMNTLKATRPFRLFLKPGIAGNEYGPLGFLLFWIQSPANTSDYLVSYDIYVNPNNDAQLKLWRALAGQTHWHLFLVGARGEQEDFFEFENSYGLNEALDDFEQAFDGIVMLDYVQAVQEFHNKHSVRDLFDFHFGGVGTAPAKIIRMG